MQALWMLLASFFFATMALGIKFASHSFGTLEIVFYRGLVSVVLMALVVRARGVPLATPVPWLHTGRSLAGIAALGAWFYAIGQLPLATAMTLNYMSGVWVAAFIMASAALRGTARGLLPLLATVLLGFAGVVLTLRPTLEQGQLGAGLVGLLSGIGAALAYVQVTALGKAGEPEERTVFYFSLCTTIAGCIGLLFSPLTDWRSVPWQDAAWLIPIGIFASLGQWCMTRAYRNGATLTVATLQYSGIVFAALYSLLCFGDQIPLLGWCGMALIVASGVLATLLRRRQQHPT